jgi:hypothetical protein
MYPFPLLSNDLALVMAACAAHTAPERLYPELQLKAHPGYAPIVPFAGALPAQENE